MKKAVPAKKIEKKEPPEGLQQTFKDKNGKLVKLIKVLKPNDVWETNGKTKRTIISHSGVQKIADAAGVSKDVEYSVLTQPTAMNGYQYTIQARIKRIKHLVNEDNQITELGEANRNNLGSRGRNNPGNMAQKRAYDRAVFRLIGITGILSEEELSDEEVTNEMDGLTSDEMKKIAPAINQLLLATGEKDLIVFGNKMKVEAKNLTENELAYLRKLYQKTLAGFKKVRF